MWLNQLRLLSRERAATTATVIVGLFVLFLIAPLIIFGPFDATAGSGTFDFETLTSGISWQIVVSLVLLLLVAVLGWGDITKLSSKVDRPGLRPLYAILVYPIVGIAASTFILLEGAADRSAFEVLAIVLILNFFVGLSEELLFRGFLFGGLRQRFRLINAIILSSIAFGLLHLINAGAGQSLTETAFQIVMAATLGALFCGLVLQSNSIWPAIVMHMVWNGYAMMGIATTEDIPDQAQMPVPELTVWSLILPILILLIACAVLYSFRVRTGIKLRDVVPAAPDMAQDSDLPQR